MQLRAYLNKDDIYEPVEKRRKKRHMNQQSRMQEVIYEPAEQDISSYMNQQSRIQEALAWESLRKEMQTVFKLLSTRINHA